MEAEIEKLEATVTEKMAEIRAEERKRTLSLASVNSNKSAKEQTRTSPGIPKRGAPGMRDFHDSLSIARKESEAHEEEDSYDDGNARMLESYLSLNNDDLMDQQSDALSMSFRSVDFSMMSDGRRGSIEAKFIHEDAERLNKKRARKMNQGRVGCDTCTDGLDNCRIF